MGYSYSHPWISDYHFSKAMAHQVRELGQTVSVARKAVKSLLLWGGTDPDGEPHLHPAFVLDAPLTVPQKDGPFRIAGEDEDGRVLFPVTFAMSEVRDGNGGSSFAMVVPALPEWRDSLARITVTGPGGTTVLDGEDEDAVALLRDPFTGTSLAPQAIANH